MNYAAIKYFDIANGSGVRTSLFVSGCTHRCKGCFNAVAWDFSSGQEFDQPTEDAILDSLRPVYVLGLSLLGGEPMEPENLPDLIRLVTRVKAELPGKSVWVYSGYTWEQLTGKDPSRVPTELALALLRYTDVLVDGEFVEDLKDITLRFRGSSNQRIINVQETLLTNRITLWQDDAVYGSHGH